MSLCQPVALVASSVGATPFQLAQDALYLYWTDDNANSISRTDKKTGGHEPLAVGTPNPVPIAVDDAGIFWGDDYGIWQCPKAGCAAGPTFVAQEFAHAPSGLAIDDRNVYWSEQDVDLLWAPKSAADASPGVLWQGDASARHVATDGRRVYFTAGDGRLHAVAVDGSSPVAVGIANPNGSYGVALEPMTAYWSVPDPTGGLLGSTPTSPDGAVLSGVVASGLRSPRAIATDGTGGHLLDRPRRDDGQRKHRRWIGLAARKIGSGPAWAPPLARLTPRTAPPGSRCSGARSGAP
jgi:hypothetical protein